MSRYLRISVATSAVLVTAALNPHPASANAFSPYLVKDIYFGGGNGVLGGGGNPGDFSTLNGELLFRGSDGVGTGVLWKSDGTEAGTVRVREDGPTGVLKHQTISSGKLFFLAEGIDGDGIGEELWVSDGTSAGTFLVKDIYPGASALPQELTDVNGTLFFRARDGTHGFELWKTDGSESGTVMVKDINAGAANSNPGSLMNLNGILFFAADDVSGGGLWQSDGSEAGTEQVKDINPVGIGQVITGNTLLFPAFTSLQGRELWRTDGTEAGTTIVMDIRPGTSSGLPFQNYLTKQNDSTVFFRGDDGTNGEELWKSDGTEGGTVMVKDINPGSANGAPARLTNLNGTIFFQADDGTHGTELWRSDGTEAGTELVVDLISGSGSPGFNSSELVAVNDLLFFTAVLPGAVRNNSTLYVTDGTEVGTQAVFTIEEHSSSTVQITNLEFTGTHLFFRAPIDIDPNTGARSNYELFAVEISVAPLLLGDYNGNDVIDAADYTVWRDAMTAGSTDLLNDPTPGTVDESDFLYWRDHFGEVLGSGAGADSAVAVPEPSSLILALAACLGIAAVRARWL